MRGNALRTGDRGSVARECPQDTGPRVRSKGRPSGQENEGQRRGNALRAIKRPFVTCEGMHLGQETECQERGNALREGDRRSGARKRPQGR